MKSKIPFLLIALVLKLSCQNQPSNQMDTADYQGNIYNSETQISESSDQKEDGLFKSMFNNGKKTHEFRDARTGIVVVTSEYPSNWQVISKPVYTLDQKLPIFLTQVQGPNNLQTFNTPIHFNIDFSNPQSSQIMRTYSRLGHLIKPIMHKEQIMQQEVNSRLTNKGFSLIGQKKMPRAERYIQKMMNEQGASQAQFEHYATEWTNNKGQKALVTLVTVAMTQYIPALNDNMLLWFYSLDYMFVDEGQFENTIDQMAEVNEGSKETNQWKQYKSQLFEIRRQKALMEQKRIGNDRQAAFDAHQRKMKAMSDAQDISHASFMNRNFGAGSDTGQRQFVNMINEEETVYNPNTGRNYQVNAGSAEYWMDSDRNYIANDNLFYNPNGDINLNHKEWTKVKKAF